MQIKKDTNRIAKVNSLIQKELGPILHEFLDFQKGLVTISKVETSRDMKWAKVWISIFNGDDEKILGYISRNIYDVQGELNKHFATKIIPRLQFFLDTSPRYVEHIDELVRKVHEEEQAVKPALKKTKKSA
ncbi:MAG: ribosome-binding factor A [Patescibacteria group bacterium]|nr:ribosome-binding factor A [Patescibacteria group bacterium]